MENSVLPGDLLLQILVRLPVKSLLLFRCVSKSWDILISSQDFAKMHFNRSLIDPKPLRLICKERRFMEDEQTHGKLVFAADFSELENFAESIQRLHHPLKISGRSESTIIGSSNGLLCATWLCYKYPSRSDSYEESFIVFNPLTRKCQWILSGHTTMFSAGRSNFYGFGYDDVHDDYKVVTWDDRDDQWGGDYDYSRFEVYSVRNASWSTRNSGLLRTYMQDISCGVLVNCVLHWIWTNHTIPGHTYDILAFDLTTEEHMIMETPENHLAILEVDDDDECYCRMDLGVLNGCLCGIVFDIEVPNKLDLWVMKVYGVKDSWMKMTIDMPSQVHTRNLYTKPGTPSTRIVPILHVENKKRMMLYSYEEGFLLCDMVTNELSKVIKLPEFGPERGGYSTLRKFSFVPKEFCFQGSLVQPLGFCSFDSFWKDKKRKRMQHKANRRVH